MNKALSGRLSTTGAAYVRFVYALPLAWAFVGALAAAGSAVPPAQGAFLLWCLAGGTAQMLFTAALLWTFTFRSFAVGTAFSKMEVVVVAVLGAALLGDGLGPLAWLAVAVSALGAVALAVGGSGLSLAAFRSGDGLRTAGAGLLSAGLLGLSSVGYRGATLALGWPDFVMAAAFTLAVALSMQTVLMGGWMLAFDRAELGRVFAEWRRAAPVGAVGMACSVFWFIAFTLQNAAYVRALGQVELAFTVFASVAVFHERITRAEAFGVACIVAAVLLILLAG
jgi:drug/metabolite transporter (DMT)-like permease